MPPGDGGCQAGCGRFRPLFLEVPSGFTGAPPSGSIKLYRVPAGFFHPWWLGWALLMRAPLVAPAQLGITHATAEAAHS